MKRVVSRTFTLLAGLALAALLLAATVSMGAHILHSRAPGLSLPAVYLWMAQTMAAAGIQLSDHLHLTDLPAGPPLHLFPIPANYTASIGGGRLIFSHIADGRLTGTALFYRTTFMLVNDTAFDISGSIAFFDDAGKPLVLALDNAPGSTFPFTLRQNSQRRFVTSGEGNVKAGWALIESDQPLNGTSGFEIRDSGGFIYGDVGVSESFLGTTFTIFADTTGTNVNTGLALVNPDTANSNNLKLEIFGMDGKKAGEATLSLGPRGHIARFLTELFPKVANIGQFEGSVVITSTDQRKFGGITLRITGDQLTSLPMVAPPAAGATVTRMQFAQIADGLIGNLNYKTSIILFNNTGKDASGEVDFFNSDATPMTVTIAGKAGSVFPFTKLVSGAVLRLVTSGTGTGHVGWARVKMDQPLSGSAMFQVLDKGSKLLAEVGVANAVPRSNFVVIADSLPPFNTGIALANPNESNQSTYCSVTLMDNNGEFKASSSFTMKPNSHQAQFIDQIFPKSQVPDIGNFEGVIKYKCPDVPVVLLSLRTVDEKLTSVPTLRPGHGYKPISVLTPAQNLAGTAPAMRWNIHQDGADLSTGSIQVSAPDFGLQTTGLNVGDDLGYGMYMMDVSGSAQGGLFHIKITGLSGGINFATDSLGPLSGDNRQKLQLSGKIQGSASGNLTIKLDASDVRPGIWNGAIGIDLDFFLRAGLIVTPAKPSTVTVSTTVTSVSSKLEEDGVPVRVQVAQPLSFVTPNTAKANLLAIHPVAPGPGSTLTITGTNFGTNPVIHIVASDGNTLDMNPFSTSGNILTIVLPDSFSDGTLQIDNGSGPGNPYYVKTMFSPTVKLIRSSAGDVMVGYVLSQVANQLQVDSYTLRMFNVNSNLASLTVGSVVGSYITTGGSTSTNSSTYQLKVESVTTDTAVLQVVTQGSTSPNARITVQKTTGNFPGLSLAYAPASPYPYPMIFGFPMQSEVKFSGLTVNLVSTADGGTTYAGRIQSVPTSDPGAGTALRAIFP